jgi:predicted nucleotidyltransferase
VRLVLHRLVDHGLVSAHEAGAATLYALNREHVAASVIEGLLRLRADLIERIRREVHEWATRPVHVSIFGSAARGDGSIASDVDLLIVRPEQVADDDAQWREQLHRLAEHIQLWSGNHASLHELAPHDLRAMLRRRGPIIASLREQSVAVAGPEFADLAIPGRTVA